MERKNIVTIITAMSSNRPPTTLQTIMMISVVFAGGKGMKEALISITKNVGR